MKENFQKLKHFRWIALSLVLFLIVLLWGVGPWYMIMLTIAQLVYVPTTFYLVCREQGGVPRYYALIAIPAFLSVVYLNITEQTSLDTVFAGIWLLYTLMIALYGIGRFLDRGFTHVEELIIDVGLIFVAMGGAWLFAYEANIAIGFSPLITWLTAIHFHYSAFLLPIFVGFLGRMYQSKLYKVSAIIIAISPILVALGITFSVWIEVISVLLYIVAIYSLIVLSFRAAFSHPVQKWLIRVSFTTLAITIVFSLCYAVGNFMGYPIVSIDFMLKFHGILNCVLFALSGVIGWSITVPTSQFKQPTFPISQIRGKARIGENILSDIVDKRHAGTYHGLVDDMNDFKPDIDTATLSKTIVDFYENTNQYRLFAEVKWRAWFRPFAVIYRLFSSRIKQINLPLSNEKVEMSGEILPVDDTKDHRYNTRAWVRKVDNDVIFIALYSSHTTVERSYMNIALPLPVASMIGILELQQLDGSLLLTSKRSSREADSGIYLTFAKKLFKLPIEESFLVTETETGALQATHNMWLLSIPFLSIDYRIFHKSRLK